MRLSQTPFSYWPVRLGFILIVLALLMSVVGLHKTSVGYTVSGTMGKGFYTIGNDTFEKEHLYADRTLRLSSRNASLTITWGTSNYPLNLTGNVTLKPGGQPSVEVISGNVSYEYNATSWHYPYASLAVPALILMVTGTVLVYVGYIRFKGG